ncbi:MAG TPA: hypothetical protein VFN55_10460 [Solirubrobacteraceae bacterium]|nr:hypothetical protein [Solirubrobacteraceae bacterium]
MQQLSVLRSASVCRCVLLAAALAALIPASALAVSPSQIQSYYNELRSANGIPGDLALDQASSANCALHNHYAAVNGNDYPNPHQETPGKPGFTTGGDWAARNSELAGGSGLTSAFAPFDEGHPEWNAPFVGAPFHLMGLLNPANTTVWGADTEGRLCIGEGGARPAPVIDTMYSFPGDGTSVAWAEPSPNEYPTSPQAVAGMPAGTVAGPALMAYWRGPSDASNPPLDVLSAATMTGPGGQLPVDIVSDQQSSLVPSGAGFVIPTSPLVPGAHYTATVTFSTAADAFTPRSWSQSFSFTAAGPPPARSLVHIAAVNRPGPTVEFVMNAEFPAAGQPATLSVTSSNPLDHIQGGKGTLAGTPSEQLYPLAAPGPGGWLRLSLAVPAYTVGGVTIPATTFSKTVAGPPLSSVLVALHPRRSYATTTVAGPGIVLSFRVKRPGTRVQAALEHGNQIYAVSRRVTAGRSGHVKLILRAPVQLLHTVLGPHRSERMTLALRIGERGAPTFEIDRSVTMTR